ncbi:hypothetical protein C823_001789 [Eubacterium plexicaudatum ASF492]|nr:hypothetical protein C823_001789 [Eubacterium plexicaudatum ASF492]
MNYKIFKRMLCASLAAAMIVPMAACGSESNDSGDKEEAMDVTLDQIKLGEDYTDIKADLKFLTHKTDVVDTTFANYITEFQNYIRISTLNMKALPHMRTILPHGLQQATGAIFVWFLPRWIRKSSQIILQSLAIKQSLPSLMKKIC